MFKRKTVGAILAAGFFVVGVCFGQTLKENWNDFLHYTKIGRLDLAKGYAQAVLESNPDPLELLTLSEENPQGYAILLRVIDTASDAELVELSKKVLDIIEQGRFVRRADPKIIAEEIRRLSGTSPRSACSSQTTPERRRICNSLYARRNGGQFPERRIAEYRMGTATNRQRCDKAAYSCFADRRCGVKGRNNTGAGQD